MQKEVVEVPILSDVIRKIGVPLSLVTRANGFVFVSGTPPFDTKTGQLVRGDIEAQTESVAEGGAALSGERGLLTRPGGDGAGLREQRGLLSHDQQGLRSLLSY